MSAFSADSFAAARFIVRTFMPGQPLTYGQSVTDACISWEDTVPLLDQLARSVRDRRARNM